MSVVAPIDAVALCTSGRCTRVSWSESLKNVICSNRSWTL